MPWPSTDGYAWHSFFGDTVPDGVMLDRQDAGCQQLKLLVKLDAPRACGQLEAVVEHRREGLTLQRPAHTLHALATCTIRADLHVYE